MSNVTELFPSKSPNEVLENAKGNFKDVVVIGFNEEGFLVSIRTMGLSKAEVILALEMYKADMLSGECS